LIAERVRQKSLVVNTDETVLSAKRRLHDAGGNKNKENECDAALVTDDMGGCLGTPADHPGGGGRRRGSGGRRRRGEGGDPNRSSSRRGSGFSDSTSSGLPQTTKNRPLRPEKIRWKSDMPLTEGQLKSKRDEFWDTAPAFEGKAEIWAALKAATEATEMQPEPDYQLAQAILDGACISLPHGSLNECYDELGMRYTIPVYCLSYPINIVADSAGGGSGSGRPDSPAEFSVPVNGEQVVGQEIKIRVRISLTEEEKRLVVNTGETVLSAKRRLYAAGKNKESDGGGGDKGEHHPRRGGAVPEPARQRWYFSGKLLGDRTKIGDAKIPSGYVVQCVVNNLDFEVIKTNSKD